MTHTTQSLKLDQIRVDGGTQSRVNLNQDTVGEYALALENGDIFPPVTTFFDGTDYWLADGFHRFAANVQIGARTVDVDVRVGTQRDAQFFSSSANNKHGLPPTRADRRHAAFKLLADAEWSKMSDRAIAKQCGIHHTTVGEYRSSLVDSTSEKSTERTYTTKHGTEATMNTGAIGKAAAPDAAPAPSPATDTGCTVATPPATSAQLPGPVTATQPAQQATSPTPALLPATAPAPAAKSIEADDSLDGFDPVAELEIVMAELDQVRRDLAAATADDLAAEAMKWRRIAEQAQRRQNDLMTSINQRESELTWMSRDLRNIGKAVGVIDPRKVLRAVQDMAAHLAE